MANERLTGIAKVWKYGREMKHSKRETKKGRKSSGNSSGIGGGREKTG